MRLTEKKSIEVTIEQWEWLTETGRMKEGWPGWIKYGRMHNDCFLCEYDKRNGNEDCEHCPYYKRFGDCATDGQPFTGWVFSPTSTQRKIYAKLFLEQMYELRGKT